MDNADKNRRSSLLFNTIDRYLCPMDFYINFYYPVITSSDRITIAVDYLKVEDSAGRAVAANLFYQRGDLPKDLAKLWFHADLAKFKKRRNVPWTISRHLNDILQK